jgi:eukaryotic-like serine/threonine-protein kinase
MVKWRLGLVCLALAPGWLTYANKTYNYSVDYPQDWVKSSISGGVAFLSPRDGPNDDFQENVNILIQDLSDHPMTLEQYTTISRNRLIQNFGDSAIITMHPGMLAGQKAEVAVYKFNYQSRALKIKQYFLVKTDQAFVVTYTAVPDQFARYDSTAMRIINSFRFN